MSKFIKFLLCFILLSLSIYIVFILWPNIIGIINFIMRILLPFIISFVIAYILNPLVNILEKYLRKRSLAVLFTLFILILIIYLSLTFTIPFFINEIKGFMENYDEIVLQIENRINQFSEKFSFLPIDYQPSFANIKEMIQSYLEKINIKPETILNKLISYISVIVVIPMTLVYFLLDYNKVTLKIKQNLEIKNKIHFKEYLEELDTSVKTFVKTTLIIMLIMASLSTISFLIAGLDYPLLFGVIIAITNVIPYLGPYIGGAFPVLYALIDSPSLAVIILVIVVIIQVIESDIISPYLHGKRNDINPVLVIFGLVFFGKIFGVIGMILSVPLMSIIKITLSYYPIENIKNKLISKI